MLPALSIYLDLVRFGAALIVVLHHVWPLLVPGHALPWPGHHAVVVFFVLSGLVIAYATDRKDTTLAEYVAARLSRLWSVAVPALALGLLIALCFPDLSLPGDAFSVRGNSVTGTMANLFFVAEFWSADSSPPYNAPFWSLSYEAAYYGIFAAWTFAPAKWRAPLALVACCVAGPKIITLFPCWLLGVWLYRYHAKIEMRQSTAVALFIVSLVGYAAIFWTDLPILIRSHMDRLFPETMGSLGASNTFVGDTLIAVFVAVNFVSAPRIPLIARALEKWRRAIAALASYTLTIYLFHAPLTALFYGALGLRSFAVIALLVLSIWQIGRFTEHRRGTLRRLIGRIFGKFGPTRITSP